MEFNFLLWGLLIGLALFSYWLNYCMGTPLADNPNEVDVGAIFFFIPNRLARRRLKQHDLLADYRRALAEDLLATSDPVRRLELRQENRRDAYAQGRKFFTWERSLLCPICFHWWLTILVIAGGLLISFNLFFDLQAPLAYLVTHLIIRKLS